MIKTFIFLFYLPAVFSAIYEPYALWEKRSVEICFVDDVTQIKKTSANLKKLKYINVTLSSAQRESLILAAKKEFTIEKTGISFHGWKNCSKRPKADVFVFALAQDYPKRGKLKRTQTLAYGSSSVGQKSKIVSQNIYSLNLKRNQSKEKDYIYLNLKPLGYKDSEWLTFDSLLPLIFIHELGHVAGLRHEHAREEMNLDPNCAPTKVKKETLVTSSTHYGGYDQESIMNYCYLRSIMKQYLSTREQILSPMDIETLKSIYIDN